MKHVLRSGSFLLSCLLCSYAANAQTFGPSGNDSVSSPQNFAVEARVGTWYPNIDAQIGSATPFRDIFQRDPANADPIHWYFGGQFDWQILRMGPVGSLGVGLGAGFASATANAPRSTDTINPDARTWTARTGQRTSLNVVPMQALAVIRFDGLANAVWWLPIVPYVKGGLAYSIWWVMNGDNIARTLQVNPRTNQPDDAIGGSIGFHLAAGAMFRLDLLERNVAREWDANMGVNHSYLFGELYYTNLAGFGGRAQLDVGNLSWAAGIALEF